MTQNQKVIRGKLGVLALAKQLGTASQACKMVGVSSELQRIVNKALRKDRAERYQNIKALQEYLKACQHQIEVVAEHERSGETRQLTAPTEVIAAHRTVSSGSIILGEIKRHKLGVSATLAALGLLIVGGGYTAYRTMLRPTTTAPALATTAKITPLTSFPGLEAKQSFSPDGKQIAFMWSGEQDENWEIYIILRTFNSI